MVYQATGELHCRECFGGYIKSEAEQELDRPSDRVQSNLHNNAQSEKIRKIPHNTEMFT